MSLLFSQHWPSTFLRGCGPTAALVVALHDYGDVGATVRPVMQCWADHMPRTSFVAPDAPLDLPDAPGRRAWYRLRDAEIDIERSNGALDDSCAALEQTVRVLLLALGLTPDQLVLAGFGQGAVVALHLALARAWVGCAGVLACCTAPLPAFRVQRRARSAKVRLIQAGVHEAPHEQSFGEAVRGLMVQGIDARGSLLLADRAQREAMRLGTAYLGELVAAAHSVAVPER